MKYKLEINFPFVDDVENEEDACITVMDNLGFYISFEEMEEDDE